MRNRFWLISAFALATSLTAVSQDVEARPRQKKSAVTQKSTFNPNTKHCHFDPLPPDQKWGWKYANLTAQFVKLPDGSYKSEILPGAQNIYEKLPMASIVKLMTAAVVMDAIDSEEFTLDEMIDVTAESYCLNHNNFATKNLQTGLTEIPLVDALIHTLKLSSNTMALNLALAIGGGSVDKFVAMMNAKAKSWGMHNTHFINPHGLPEGDRKSEYTTAVDMFIMAQHLLSRFDRLKEYSTAPLKFLRVPEPSSLHSPKGEFYKLGAIFKTGSIDECYSLVTLAEEGAHNIIDIQLCGNKIARFSKATTAIRKGLERLTDMALSNAFAAPIPSQQSSLPNPQAGP